MTPAQRDLRDFIVDYQNANGGVTPSYQEMADGLDLASKSGVARMVEALKRDGYIRQRYNATRAIEVVLEGYDLTDVPLESLYAELHRRGALMARAA